MRGIGAAAVPTKRCLGTAAGKVGKCHGSRWRCGVSSGEVVRRGQQSPRVTRAAGAAAAHRRMESSLAVVERVRWAVLRSLAGFLGVTRSAALS